VVLGWVEEGVKIFRVDNPHTKPLSVLGMDDRRHPRPHPDVMFLAEAFTKPKVMYASGQGRLFSQSYTYFTWRNTKGS
jgi:starch synthase (maltosyl-transferring)